MKPLLKVRLVQYDRHMREARDLFIQRNTNYGDAFSTVGLIGSIAELIGPVMRLKQIVLKGQLIPLPQLLTDWGQPKPDKKLLLKVRDILLDVLNYAIICLMLIDDGNYTGD